MVDGVRCCRPGLCRLSDSPKVLLRFHERCRILLRVSGSSIQVTRETLGFQHHTRKDSRDDVRRMSV